MVWRAWKRLSRDQRRNWGLVAGFITVGSIFKVAYFSFSRQIMVDDAHRRNQAGLEVLREAQEFAAWSKKDRESKLPPLTPEQRQQLQNYLALVEKHGLSKSFDVANGSSGRECEGCPFMSGKKQFAAVQTNDSP